MWSAPHGSCVAQLARRIDELLREHGLDPSAWQGEVQSLRALEDADEKAAQARFHELKRALLVMRRGELLRELRGHAFARDVPSSDAKGLDVRELEREIRWSMAAVRHARDIDASLRSIRDATAQLRERPAPDAPDLTPRAWDDLPPLAEEVDLHRRAVLRELRAEEAERDLWRRATKLTHLPIVVPSTATLPAEAALADLEPVERALAEAERLEEAHTKAIAPLRAPDVREYHAQTRRFLEREALAKLQARDLDGLSDVGRRAEELATQAAAKTKQAARARRSGAPPPTGERRSGDTMDGYG